MEWNEKLATGIPKIDQGLKAIVSKLNIIHDLDVSKLDEAAIERVIRFFGRHVIESFDVEEEYMLKNAYPKYDEHKAQHMQFLKNFAMLKKLFSEEKNPSLMIMVIEYEYLNWLIKHIQTFDQEMASFLISRSSKSPGQ